MNKTQAVVGGVVVLGVGGTGVGIVLSKDDDEYRDIEFVGSVPYSLMVFEDDFDTIYAPSPRGEGYSSIGRNYGWYLVGTYGLKKGKTKNNKDWWNMSFENWKNNPSETEDFQDVKSAYAPRDSKDDKALNKVCEKVYMRESSDIYFVSSAGKRNENALGRDLLKYCSPLGKKPVQILMDGQYVLDVNDKTHGANPYKADFLVSVSYKDNDLFWELKNWEFFGMSSKDGVGVKVSKEFSPLLYALYAQKSKPNRGTIKDTCRDIYATNDEGNGQTENYWYFENYCSFRSYSINLYKSGS